MGFRNFSTSLWAKPLASDAAKHLRLRQQKPGHELTLSYSAHALEWDWQFGLYPVD